MSVPSFLKSKVKIDPNLPGEGGQTPLMRAADRGQVDKVKELLSQEETNPNVKIKTSGKIALTLAAERGHTKIADLLLKAGSNINALDDRGYTPLTAASKNGHRDTVKKLLSEGADLHIKDKGGIDAAMYAARGSHFDVARDIIAAIRKSKSKVKEGSWQDSPTTKTITSRHDVILDKTVVYLLATKEADNAFIKQFVHGYCHGITSLWLYGKWLQTQPNPEGKIRDDNEWFKSVVDMFDRWDGDLRSLSKKDRENLDRFIQSIQFFQEIGKYLPIAHGDLDSSLEDSKGRKLKKEYSTGALLNAEQLAAMLKSKNFIQDNRLILISSHNHDTAIFKPAGSKEYCFFNPNNKAGEVRTASLDEVAKLIFKANRYADEKKNSPFKFRTYTFGDIPKKDYLPQNNLFEKIKPALEAHHNYADEYTSLIMASAVGNRDAVKYFLDIGADPNFKAQNGNAALAFAASNNRSEAIEEFLPRENVDFNITNSFGVTPLMMGVEGGYDKVVKVLLKRKNIDVNAKDNEGYTALIDTAINDRPEAAKLLLEMKNIDVNAKAKNGYTALLAAARYGYADVVRELLKRDDINVHLKTKSGLTAFRFAAKFGHTKVIREFFRKDGFDFDIDNEDEREAIMSAALDGYDKAIEVAIERTSIVRKIGYSVLSLALTIGGGVMAASGDLVTGGAALAVGGGGMWATVGGVREEWDKRTKLYSALEKFNLEVERNLEDKEKKEITPSVKAEFVSPAPPVPVPLAPPPMMLSDNKSIKLKKHLEKNEIVTSVEVPPVPALPPVMSASEKFNKLKKSFKKKKDIKPAKLKVDSSGVDTGEDKVKKIRPSV